MRARLLAPIADRARHRDGPLGGVAGLGDLVAHQPRVRERREHDRELARGRLGGQQAYRLLEVGEAAAHAHPSQRLGAVLEQQRGTTGLPLGVDLLERLVEQRQRAALVAGREGGVDGELEHRQAVQAGPLLRVRHARPDLQRALEVALGVGRRVGGLRVPGRLHERRSARAGGPAPRPSGGRARRPRHPRSRPATGRARAHLRTRCAARRARPGACRRTRHRAPASAGTRSRRRRPRAGGARPPRAASPGARPPSRPRRRPAAAPGPRFPRRRPRAGCASPGPASARRARAARRAGTAGGGRSRRRPARCPAPPRRGTRCLRSARRRG